MVTDNKEQRDKLKRRLAEIDAELQRPNDLAREREAILRELETEENAPEIEYSFAGAPGKDAMHRLTVVEMEDGTFLELPHTMFEASAAVGLKPLPISRDDYMRAKKEGRVFEAGRATPISLETARRLTKAGYAVSTKQVPPQTINRSYESARV